MTESASSSPNASGLDSASSEAKATQKFYYDR